MSTNLAQYDSLHAFGEVLAGPAGIPEHNATKQGFLAHAGGIVGLRRLWAEGWQDGVKKLKAAMEDLEPPNVTDLRRKPRWADQGEDLSLDRLYGGALDSAWRRTSRVSRIAPTPVRITVDVEAHAGVGGDSMFWRGACATLLAEALALAGYPVQVVATSGAGRMADGSYTEYITVIVKDFDAPMILPSLLATTAHESFLRACVFSHNVSTWKGAPCTGGGFFGGYSLGRSIATDTPEALRALGFDQPNIRTVAVPRMVISKERALAWVQEKVAELEAARV